MADRQIELNKNKAGLLVVLNPDNNYDNDSNFLLVAKATEYVKPNKYINTLFARLMELRNERLDDDETIEDLISDHVTFFIDEYDLEMLSRKRIISAPEGVTPSSEVEGYTRLVVDCPGETPRIQGIPTKVFNLELATGEDPEELEDIYGLIVMLGSPSNDDDLFLISNNKKHIEAMYTRLEEIKENPPEDSRDIEERITDHLMFFIEKFKLKSIDASQIVEVLNVKLEDYTQVKIKDPDNTNETRVIPCKIYNLYNV